MLLQICGVWRKVPRIYKQLLRDEKIWVALVDDKSSSSSEGGGGGGAIIEALTGRIGRYSKALSTELLSAVLTVTASAASAEGSSPPPSCVAGGGSGGDDPAAAAGVICPAGTAALSIASASNSVHLTVAVSGLLSLQQMSGGGGGSGGDAVIVETLVVRLETVQAVDAAASGGGSAAAPAQSRVIEELVTVQKPQEVRTYAVQCSAVQCCLSPLEHCLPHFFIELLRHNSPPPSLPPSLQARQGSSYGYGSLFFCYVWIILLLLLFPILSFGCCCCCH